MRQGESSEWEKIDLNDKEKRGMLKSAGEKEKLAVLSADASTKRGWLQSLPITPER